MQQFEYLRDRRWITEGVTLLVRVTDPNGRWLASVGGVPASSRALLIHGRTVGSAAARRVVRRLHKAATR